MVLQRKVLTCGVYMLATVQIAVIRLFLVLVLITPGRTAVVQTRE